MALCALLALYAQGAEPKSPRFSVEFTDPEVASYASVIRADCEEWYPKIASLLFGALDRGDPAEVRLVFKEQPESGYATMNTKSRVWTMHLSSTEAKTPAALDYRAVAIHELTHVVQNHAPVPGSLVWLSEGIADYVTYTYFTKTNAPRLQLDKQGFFTGYTETQPYLFGLQKKRVRPDGEYRPRRVRPGKGYRHGYTVAAAFLLWLETRKSKDIVQKLSVALFERRFRMELFERHCGAKLDTLWREFLAESAAGGRDRY